MKPLLFLLAVGALIAQQQPPVAPPGLSNGTGSGGGRGGPAAAAPVRALVQKVDAAYSPEARAAGLQGAVVVSYQVTPEGAVVNPRVRRGLGFGLDQRALEAVQEWRYAPSASGRNESYTVEVPFILDPPDSWMLSGSTYSLDLHERVMERIKPQLIAYTAPDAGICPAGRTYVGVNLTIDADGVPAVGEVTQSREGAAAESARKAAQSWRFRPALADGQPRPSKGTILLECAAPGVAQADDPSAPVSRVGNGISAPAFVFKVEPEYSEEARKAKYQGTVLLSLIVEPSGKTSQIRVTRSLGQGLDEEAIAAVTQWRFKPAMKDGQAVRVMATVSVDFKLL